MPQLPEHFNYAPELRESLGELTGLARGLLADQKLSDDEITFLDEWLDARKSLSASFPGNVIHDRIKDVLSDGVITEDERSHLVDTLTLLIEDRSDELNDNVELTELWFDEAGLINFPSTRFFLTGNFVYGPKLVCQQAIEKLGGIVSPGIQDEPQFLVIGGLGVDEWRRGQLGPDIEAALWLRKKGKPLKIIHEDAWASQPGLARR